MTPEEARLVMNAWAENQSQLALVGQLWGVGFALRCRVAFVTEETLALSTSDGGRIAISICEAGTEFRYSQPREFPTIVEKFGLASEQQLASGLTIFFASRLVLDEGEEEPEPESLHFSELVT
jgi:hypothetical protein